MHLNIQIQLAILCGHKLSAHPRLDNANKLTVMGSTVRDHARRMRCHAGKLNASAPAYTPD